MIRGIQLIGLFIGIFFIYQSYRLVKEKKEDVESLLMWSVVGAGFIIVSIYPGIFDYALGILQMRQRPFAIFTIGILIAYVILFQMFKLIRTINENISKLNENMAVLRYDVERGRRKK